jgi:osmotically-inducible protein OsmY
MVDRRRVGAAEEEYAQEAREPAGYRLSDASIKEQILRQLAQDEGLDAGGIMVEVRGDEVTLSGSVRRYADMQRVEELACAIDGVKLVRNGLTSLEPAPPADDDGQPAGAASKMGKPGYDL